MIESCCLILLNYCEQHDNDVLNMNTHYAITRGRSCRQDGKSSTTMEHHLELTFFTTTIDFQLQEPNNRFSEHAIKLFIPSVALRPKDAYKLFKIDDICN